MFKLNPVYPSDKFIPERWTEHKETIHPMTARIFGHGPRMCLGKRLAELEIQLAVVKLLQNFRIEWADPDVSALEPRVGAVNSPNKKLQFRFVDL